MRPSTLVPRAESTEEDRYSHGASAPLPYRVGEPSELCEGLVFREAFRGGDT